MQAIWEAFPTLDQIGPKANVTFKYQNGQYLSTLFLATGYKQHVMFNNYACQ